MNKKREIALRLAEIISTLNIDEDQRPIRSDIKPNHEIRALAMLEALFNELMGPEPNELIGPEPPINVKHMLQAKTIERKMEVLWK